MTRDLALAVSLHRSDPALKGTFDDDQVEIPKICQSWHIKAYILGCLLFHEPSAQLV